MNIILSPEPGLTDWVTAAFQAWLMLGWGELQPSPCAGRRRTIPSPPRFSLATAMRDAQ